MLKNIGVFLVVMMSLCLVSCAWNTSEFNEGKAKGMLEAMPVTLESEQVSLTREQVDCGVGAELWDAPTQVSKDRVTSRLSAQGRALNFSDDLTVVETGYRQPYAQVRGSFMLQVNDISSIHDAKEQGVKIVDVKAGIKVSHPCLVNPLPIMGVKRGAFSADVPSSFEFSLQSDGWHVERMIH